MNLSGKSAWAYSNEINIRCFSADSFVQLSNGKKKFINEIQLGDEILTIENSKIISTEFIFMLHQHQLNQALFYRIKTKSGHEISLTKYHLIGIESSHKKFNYHFAKDVRKGDFLYILMNNQVQCSPVVNITIERKIGYYSPLTTKGSLLINQILASSFAHITNHYEAQLVFYPLRIFYRIISFLNLKKEFFRNNNNDDDDQLHWIISFFFHWTKIFRPKHLFI